jgi:hypothetical protein
MSSFSGHATAIQQVIKGAERHNDFFRRCADIGPAVQTHDARPAATPATGNSPCSLQRHKEEWREIWVSASGANWSMEEEGGEVCTLCRTIS